MTGAEAIPPLVHDFVVAATPEHAFATWVERIATWWPAGHTISGAPVAVVVEPRVGGRIFERGPDGAEHEWGEVTDWRPPARLGFHWHLFFPRAEATHVAVTFTAEADGTRVRLEQTGWDALGAEGLRRRERTQAGWAATTTGYRELLAVAGTDHGTMEAR